jgi:hypothetical protein
MLKYIREGRLGKYMPLLAAEMLLSPSMAAGLPMESGDIDIDTGVYIGAIAEKAGALPSDAALYADWAQQPQDTVAVGGYIVMRSHLQDLQTIKGIMDGKILVLSLKDKPEGYMLYGLHSYEPSTDYNDFLGIIKKADKKGNKDMKLSDDELKSFLEETISSHME